MARDNAFARQVQSDYTRAGLSRRERAIADYAIQVTRDARSCTPLDLDRLRRHGLADRDLLALVLIVAYYNMSNRLFEALSVFEPDSGTE